VISIPFPSRRFFVLSLLFFTGTLVLAEPMPRGVELRRGVILDGLAANGYFSVPGGGIEAVDLATGRTLWTSEDAALPLALYGRLLVTQAEDERPMSRLRIVVFDVEGRGHKVIESTIPLPEDVDAVVDDELTRSFRASVAPDAGGFVVSWLFKDAAIEGMKRSEEVAPEREVTGAAHIDLATGRAVAVAPRRAIADALAERLKASNVLAQLPWRTGDVLAATEGGRGGPLLLKRWDALTGAALPDRQLVSKGLVALPSADRSHLLASERAGEGGSADPEYRWSLFSAESGEPVGELRRDVSASPFVLSDGNIVFETPPNGFRSGGAWIEEPLKIRAVHLSNGNPIWDREIRDLRYRGPVPPAQPRKAPNPRKDSPSLPVKP
jgi:hypothetical protein